MKQSTRTIFLLCIFICFTIDSTACAADVIEDVIIQPSNTPPTPTTAPIISAPTPDEETIVIGAILFLNDNFFETVALGMEDTAEEAGVDIQFKFHEDDVALEAQWIREFVEQGVDAILISPRIVDRDESIAAIHEAYEANIPVVCYNGCFTDEKTAENIVGIFETDQYAVGYQVGNYLVEWLEVRGIEEPHIGILSCCEKRDAGFRQALTDNNLVWDETANYEEYRADESMIAAENMLQKNPQINVLWAQNEGATIGAVSGVRAENRGGDVFVFGVDISPQIAQMLLADDDTLQAVAAQSPYEIGRLTTKAALAALENGEKAGHHYVEMGFFSRDDLEAVETYLANQ